MKKLLLLLLWSGIIHAQTFDFGCPESVDFTSRVSLLDSARLIVPDGFTTSYHGNVLTITNSQGQSANVTIAIPELTVMTQVYDAVTSLGGLSLIKNHAKRTTTNYNWGSTNHISVGRGVFWYDVFINNGHEVIDYTDVTGFAAGVAAWHEERFRYSSSQYVMSTGEASEIATWNNVVGTHEVYKGVRAFYEHSVPQHNRNINQTRFRESVDLYGSSIRTKYAMYLANFIHTWLPGGVASGSTAVIQNNTTHGHTSWITLHEFGHNYHIVERNKGAFPQAQLVNLYNNVFVSDYGRVNNAEYFADATALWMRGNTNIAPEVAAFLEPLYGPRRPGWSAKNGIDINKIPQIDCGHNHSK